MAACIFSTCKLYNLYLNILFFNYLEENSLKRDIIHYVLFISHRNTEPKTPGIDVTSKEVSLSSPSHSRSGEDSFCSIPVEDRTGR